MTVKLRGPAGGIIDVADDTADRFLSAGYTKVTEPKAKPAKTDPPRSKRKGD